MKVLFVGGTGVISSACAQLAVARGIDLVLFNRGETERPVVEGARVLHGDIRELVSVASKAVERQTTTVTLAHKGTKRAGTAPNALLISRTSPEALSCRA